MIKDMIFQREIDFQESPIGKIPKDWNVQQLGNKSIADIIAGQSPPSSTYNKENCGLPFLQGKMEFGEMFPSPTTYCSDPIKVAEKSDILLSVRAPVGDVNVAPFECCVGRGLAAIRAKADRLNHLFLFYYLIHGGKRFKALSTGSTFKAIRRQEIEKFSIPLPSIKEQRNIVGVLGVVDLAIEKTGRVIAKTERLKKGLMQELLTKGIGHTECKYSKELGHQIPKEWQVVKLEDYAYIKGRIGWRGLKASEYTEKGPYLIANKHIINNKIAWEVCDHLSDFRYEESPEIQLKTNDIIISKDGTIGEAAIVNYLPEKATINSTMMLIRVTNENLAPNFLLYFYQGPGFRRFIGRKVSGTSIPHLFQRDMRNLSIALPPLQEQQQIMKILFAVDRKLELEFEGKAKLEKVKVSLMDLLLTGKVRAKVD